MPELPEVQCVREGIWNAFGGRQVEDVWHDSLDNLIDPHSLPLRKIRGQTLSALERRGKYMLWHLGKFRLLAHLGMSGVFQVDGAPGKHTHLQLRFDNGTLCYTDPRRFGHFDLQESGTPLQRWDALGPDALSAECSGPAMEQRAMGSRVDIKNWILDQNHLAGVGNIYACEGLFAAGIAPCRAAGTLDKKEWQQLVAALKKIMKAAIRNRGTTFSDYRLTNGKGGAFQSFLQVFQKENLPCPRCGEVIRRQVQNGRSTFWCAVCQK